MTDEQYQRLKIVLTQSQELKIKIIQLTDEIKKLTDYINNGAFITKLTIDTGNSALNEISLPIESVDGAPILTSILATKQSILENLQQQYTNLEIDPNVCSCECTDNCSCKQGGNVNE